MKVGCGLDFSVNVYPWLTFRHRCKLAGLVLWYDVNYGYTKIRKVKPSAADPT